MKAILMRSYNKAEVVEVIKVTEDMIEDAKQKDIKLSKFTNDEYMVTQTIFYADGLIFHEESRQKNDRFSSSQSLNINLKVGDILVKTELGYQVNMLPLKLITDKEDRLIQKYNQLGK
jgi:hypothetical protein